MIHCEMCGQPLKECCDLFYTAVSETGEEFFVCADCADELDTED